VTFFGETGDFGDVIVTELTSQDFPFWALLNQNFSLRQCLRLNWLQFLWLRSKKKA